MPKAEVNEPQARAERVLREKVRSLVRKHGATGAARVLEMNREVVLAIASDAHVQEGSLLVAESRLERVEARAQ
jgi:hypothetical protein